MELPKGPRARNVLVAILGLLIAWSCIELATKGLASSHVKVAPVPAETNQEKLLRELGQARTGAVVWLMSFQCGTKETGVHPEAKASYEQAKKDFKVAEGRLRLMKKTSGDAYIQETFLAYQSANYALRRANREQYCELDSYVEGVGWTPRTDAPADAAADYCRPVESSLLP